MLFNKQFQVNQFILINDQVACGKEKQVQFGCSELLPLTLPLLSIQIFIKQWGTFYISFFQLLPLSVLAVKTSHFLNT
jgi:hypothetical protein